MATFEAMTRRVIREFKTDPIIFQPNDRGQYTVDAIYSEIYREVDPGGVVISSRRPTLFVGRGDLHRLPTSRDLFAVRGEYFRVLNVEPDEEGGVSIELERVS